MLNDDNVINTLVDMLSSNNSGETRMNIYSSSSKQAFLNRNRNERFAKIYALLFR